MMLFQFAVSVLEEPVRAERLSSGRFEGFLLVGSRALAWPSIAWIFGGLVFYGRPCSGEPARLLFVGPVYFSATDSLANQMKKKIRKSRQGQCTSPLDLFDVFLILDARNATDPLSRLPRSTPWERIL